MATYIVLNLVVVALVYLLLRPKGLFTKSRLITLGFIMLLTIVFDNLMIGVNLFYYNDLKILGVFIGNAPIEDFFYAILAVMIVPELWQRFAKKEPQP
ncbi:MAG: lycopene cyclase domain-containing protein [Candidatus Saccharimonadales bacterium]